MSRVLRSAAGIYLFDLSGLFRHSCWLDVDFRYTGGSQASSYLATTMIPWFGVKLDGFKQGR